MGVVLSSELPEDNRELFEDLLRQMSDLRLQVSRAGACGRTAAPMGAGAAPRVLTVAGSASTKVRAGVCSHAGGGRRRREAGQRATWRVWGRCSRKRAMRAGAQQGLEGDRVPPRGCGSSSPRGPARARRAGRPSGKARSPCRAHGPACLPGRREAPGACWTLSAGLGWGLRVRVRHPLFVSQTCTCHPWVVGQRQVPGKELLGRGLTCPQVPAVPPEVRVHGRAVPEPCATCKVKVGTGRPGFRGPRPGPGAQAVT